MSEELISSSLHLNDNDDSDEDSVSSKDVYYS